METKHTGIHSRKAIFPALVCVVVFMVSCAAGESRALSLTLEERAWLDANPDKLVMWFDMYYPPIEFADEREEFTGIGADIMALIEERLGVKFIRVPSPDWSRQLQSLKTGESAIAPVIVPTEERKKYALFSEPYITIPVVIIAARENTAYRSLEDLAGKRVAVVEGFVSEDYLRENYGDILDVINVKSVSEGLQDVAFGVVDAMVENLAVAAYHIDRDKLPNLRVAAKIDLYYRQSFAVSRKYPLLYSAMVKALDTVTPREVREITRKWITLQGDALSETARRLIGIGIGILTLLLASAGIFNRILKRKLDQQRIVLEKSQRELRDKTERLRLAMEAANDGLWDWDMVENRLYHSPRFYTMLGYDPDEMADPVQAWRRMVFPGDQESVSASIEETRKTLQPFNREIRMKANDGSIHWILSRGKVVERDESGMAQRIVGTHVDITDLKNAEKARMEAEAQYRDIFNNTPIGIFRTSFSGFIIDANPAMVRILGYESREELISSVPSLARDIYPDKPARDEVLSELVAHPSGITREAELKKKDGTPVFGNLTASLQFEQDGNPTFIDGSFEDITEKKLAKEALEISEKRFRTLYEVARDSIVILENGVFADMNQSFLRLLRRTREEVLGKTPADISPRVQPCGTGSSVLLEKLIEDSRTGSSMLFDWTFELPDGSPVATEVSLQEIDIQGKKLLMAMIRNVTERRRIEERVRQSEEKFSRLFMMSPDAILLSSRDTAIIREANDTFYRLFGYTPEETIGHTAAELGLYLSEEQREDILAQIDRKGFIRNRDFEVKARDGSVLTVSGSYQIVTIGSQTYTLGVLRDITDLKKMNEMMVQTEKMISLGGIAAGIAHEINNPLGIILQSAQNLERRLQPDFPKNQAVATELGVDMEKIAAYIRERKLDVFLEDIRLASLRAAEIIRNMLDFSRRSESRREMCDITSIVDKAITLASNDYDLKKKYDFKKIGIIREYEEGLPPVFITVTEIEQVFLNLLRNAAQAMHNGSSGGDPKITVRIMKTRAGIRIDVEDNGPGISKEERKRIFEPFYTTKGVGEGTGLGLSVSYFIITKGHGGSMWVADNPDGGAVFSVLLPENGPTESSHG